MRKDRDDDLGHRLGGYWKRIDTIIGGEKVPGWMMMKIGRPEFQDNRADIVSRCIERGFIDSCIAN